MLSSQEIKLLITALGAGIGADDKDLAKLRYHTIILMCDADVDGAHIRTLLLTFFYRHFQEIIERGHLFIAQPPLYRVKRGQVAAVPEGRGGARGLPDRARAPATSTLQGDRRARSTGTPLKQLVKKVDAPRRSSSIIFERKGRESPRADGVSRARRRCRPTRWPTRRRCATDRRGSREIPVRWPRPSSLPVSFDFEQDREHACLRLVASTRANGSQHRNVIDRELCLSAEFEELRRLARATCARPGIRRSRSARRDAAETAPEPAARPSTASSTAARKGLEIQRYKGLGEMNPTQLWETTMNPESPHASAGEGRGRRTRPTSSSPRSWATRSSRAGSSSRRTRSTCVTSTSEHGARSRSAFRSTSKTRCASPTWTTRCRSSSAARCPIAQRRPEARSSPHPVRDVQRGPAPQPALLEVRRRRRRGPEALPPARRLGRLRRPGPPRPGVEPPLPADRRAGKLRLDRRRSAGRLPLHGVPAARRSPRSSLADIDKETVDFIPNFDESTAGAARPPDAGPEPAHQRCRRASPSAWRRTSRRTTWARCATRLIALDRAPGAHRRRAHAATSRVRTSRPPGSSAGSARSATPTARAVAS